MMSRAEVVLEVLADTARELVGMTDERITRVSVHADCEDGVPYWDCTIHLDDGTVLTAHGFPNAE